jgi:hypothetical protein
MEFKRAHTGITRSLETKYCMASSFSRDSLPQYRLYEWQRLYAPRQHIMMPTIEWRDHAFQADTMFVERRGRLVAVFCAIEVTSRIGFVRQYTRRKPTGTETVELLDELRSAYPARPEQRPGTRVQKPACAGVGSTE